MTPRILVLALALAAACSSGDDSSGSEAATTTSVPAVDEASASTEPATTPSATTAPATTAPATAPATAPPATTSPPDSTGTSPSTSAPAADAPTLTEAQLADQELARSALITIDSFPEGWVEEPNEDDDDDGDDGFEAEFDACLGRVDEERVGDDLEPLVVSTGDFQPVDDGSTSVSHEVVLAPDVDTAVTAMSEVSVEGAESCISDVVRRFYQTTLADDPALDGVEIGEVVVTRTERERPADLAIGVLLEIPITIEEDTISQYLEVLYQRQGRALSELSFTSLGSPFSRDGYTILSDEAVIGLAPIGG